MRGNEMRMPRMLGLLAVVPLVLGGLVVMSVSAHSASHERHRPPGSAQSRVDVTVTVTDDTAQVQVVARVPRPLIRSASCTVDASPVPCGRPARRGPLTTVYHVSLSDLADGQHTFAIQLRLWLPPGHDRIAGGATFEVSTAPTNPVEQTCALVGGTYADTYEGQRFGQTCSRQFGSDQEAEVGLVEMTDILQPTCPSGAASGGETDGGLATFACSTQLAVDAYDVCTSEAVSSFIGLPGVQCLVEGGFTPESSARFQAICADLGGSYEQQAFVPYVEYRCIAAGSA
jgi:hypothetical protein